MSPGDNHADLRGWLETAILSAGATMPSAFAGSSDTETAVGSTESVIKPSQTAARSPAIARPEPGSFERSLVTVRRIANVTTLKKGYRLLGIDGWRVVASKSNRFKKGQFVVFFEPDSFIPLTSPFKNLFVEVGSQVTLNHENGYRVGTTAWTDQNGREVISQGHVLHLSYLPGFDEKVCDLHWKHVHGTTDEEFAEIIRHVDFSADLGVKRWESPNIMDNTAEDNAVEEANLNVVQGTVDKVAIDKFVNRIPTCNPSTPSFILKTSMERVQNCPNLFIKPKYERFVFQESLKMDGATMTIYFISNGSVMFDSMPQLPRLNDVNEHTYLKHAVHPTGRLGVCSRNNNLMPHLLPSTTSPAQNHYWDVAIAANLHKILPALNETMAIQAELVGQTVQGNPYNYPKTPGGPTHELFIFSILGFHPLGPRTDQGRDMIPKRWRPRKVESFAAQNGLPHVPVLGYHTIPAVAREHQDLINRAELKKGEGLVYKSCTDGRWFKVLSERWILEKGDEKLVRAAEAALAKGKGKAALTAEMEAAMKRQEARCAGGYSMSQEEARQVMAVFRDLENWMKRDDGLKKWMEEWEKGYHRGFDENLTGGVDRIGQVKNSSTGMGQSGGASGHVNRNTTAGVPAFNGGSTPQTGQMNGITTGGGSTTTNTHTQQSGSMDGNNTATGGSTSNGGNSQQNGQGNGGNTNGFRVSQSLVDWLGL